MSVLGLLHRLLGAVVLGFATILLPKARPDDHWSATPKVEVVAESENIAPASDRGRYGQT